MHVTYQQRFETFMEKAESAFRNYLHNGSKVALIEARHYREVAHAYAVMASGGGRLR